MGLKFFGRMMRRLRSTSASIGAFILFSGLLTYIFILYQVSQTVGPPVSQNGVANLESQPSKGPGEKQQLGWQSWEIVSTSNASAQKPVEDSSSTGTNLTDWWDVEADKETKPDTSSLPLSEWTPLLPHDTGCGFSLLCMYIISDIWWFKVTEITITRCMYALVCCTS